jgi:predicted nucleic acid-binding protein
MIFVDTSAIVALAFPKDQFYSEANIWQKENKKESFITTNTVVIEALGWVRYKGGRKIAVEVGEKLYLGDDIDIVKVTPEDEKNAWSVFKKLDGRGVSMVDCTSFVVMKRLKIKKVFAFDSDFAKAGFTVLPG